MNTRPGPLRNRVMPTGEIVAMSERGTLMGNRGGRLHRDDRTLAARRWRSKAWIACTLCFRGRHRAVMGAGYTELFFLDEATALAAGHRPCFECRRADARAFARGWADAHALDAPPRASVMDDSLHRQRRAAGAPPLTMPAAALADGVMIEDEQGVWLVRAGRLRRWTPAGYRDARPLAGSGTLTLVTPPAIAAVLGAGYRAMIHPSAAG